MQRKESAGEGLAAMADGRNAVVSARSNFWDDEKLQRRLASRLDRWVSLMRMHGGAQAEMIASAPEEIRDLFSKRIKLMAPLLKAWKGALKAENAVDFSGLIHQAIVILEKGRFISPWKHILVDEFQDISPQRAALLAALRKQTVRRRCSPLVMTGRRFIASAVRKCRSPPLSMKTLVKVIAAI